MQPQTPKKGMGMYTTSPTPGMKQFLQDSDMVETAGMMDGRYNTVYGNKMHGGKQPRRVGMKT